MNFPKFSARSISLSALALTFFTLITTNIYFAASESNAISGCVNKKTGVLRIASKCSGTEKIITWNKIGAQGVEGAKGDVGLQGLKGDTGVEGAAGNAGPEGPIGTNTVNTVTQVLTQKVYDATGLLVGDFLSTDASGGVTIKNDGILLSYIGDNPEVGGYLFMNGVTVYRTADCSGPKYANISGLVKSYTQRAYVSAPGLDQQNGFYVGLTTGDPINVMPNSVFLRVERAGDPVLCVPTSDPDSNEFPVTQIRLLAPLSVTSRFMIPYSIR